jgi:hypothetical protein
MSLLRAVLPILLLCSTPILAGPVITSVTPDEGSEQGNNEVVIRGSGFSTDCPGCTPDGVKPPDVFFGGVPAGTIGYIDSTELRVWVPPHAPGAVSVTVRQKDGEFTLADGYTYTQDPYKMTPSSGPLAGGTVVTITGPLSSWPYTVIFGQTPAPTWRVGTNTLIAVTPPGTGRVPVIIFEYDFGISTNLFFNYVSTQTDENERVLLPTFTPPVDGALGSKFVTEFRAANKSTDQPVRIWGLSHSCTGVCPAVVPDPQRDSIEIARGGELAPADVVYNGTPARFLYIPNGDFDHVWMNLRVYDSSRTAQNFGTEIPIVRDRDLVRNHPIVFAGVPNGGIQRSTLRIYAANAMTVKVLINAGDVASLRDVTLQPGANSSFPAYAQIGDLPDGIGPMRITITPPGPGEPGFYTPFWAFVSVTNNDTQLITTIRP